MLLFLLSQTLTTLASFLLSLLLAQSHETPVRFSCTTGGAHGHIILFAVTVATTVTFVTTAAYVVSTNVIIATTIIFAATSAFLESDRLPTADGRGLLPL